MGPGQWPRTTSSPIAEMRMGFRQRPAAVPQRRPAAAAVSRVPRFSPGPGGIPAPAPFRVAPGDTDSALLARWTMEDSAESAAWMSLTQASVPCVLQLLRPMQQPPGPQTWPPGRPGSCEPAPTRGCLHASSHAPSSCACTVDLNFETGSLRTPARQPPAPPATCAVGGPLAQESSLRLEGRRPHAAPHAAHMPRPPPLTQESFAASLEEIEGYWRDTRELDMHDVRSLYAFDVGQKTMV